MWRFITVTFAFLGVVFWELSGGADFKPIQRDTSGERQMAASTEISEPVRAAFFAPAAANASTNEAAAKDTEAEPVRTASLDMSAGLQAAATASDAAPDVGVTYASMSTQGDLRTTDGITFRATRAAARTEPQEPRIDVTRSVRPTRRALPEPGTLPQPAMTERNIDLRQVAGNVVNMRMGPSTRYSVLDKLPRGEEVEVLRDPGDGWVKLRVVSSNRVGWMAERLLVSAD